MVEASRRIFKNPDSAENYSMISTKYRTAYHFQPPQHWINDPNGPMYYNGIYHLFYQYNPYAAVWGNISWAHSVSTDLIRWTALELAIAPTEPYEANGCWSGSATILPGNKPVILYTSSNAKKEQTQNIAYPKNLSDPFLREWTKPDYNPIIKVTGDLNSSEFRDPTTGWQGEDGLWRIVVGNKIGQSGRAILYKSKDFVHWVRAKDPLSYSSGSGMWECPDFFPSGGGNKYVLKMSLDDTRADHYMLGSYDKVKDLFIPDKEFVDYRKWPRYDYGNFYASKTFFDEGKNRRILWGWSNESDSVSDDVAKGWAGIQTIPRVVWLDTSGKQLLQWPVKELEILRRKQIQLHNALLKTGGLVEIKGMKVLQADVEVEFELQDLEKAEPFNPTWLADPQKLCGEMGTDVPGVVGPFGLMVLASKDMEEHTDVFFRVFKADSRYMVLMCSDQRRSSLRPELYKPAYGAFMDTDIEKDGGKISLRTLIDHSVVESFGGGGKTVITARVYPLTLVGGNTHMYAFNKGSAHVKIMGLKAWHVDHTDL